MGIDLGSGLAYVVGGQAITYVRETAAWNLPILGTVEPWQKVFFLVGLPGMLVVPVLLLTVREPLRKGLWKRSGSAPEGQSVSIPPAEVFLYMRQNWKTILTHNVGFALLAFSGLGTTSLASRDVPTGPWLGDGSIRPGLWEYLRLFRSPGDLQRRLLCRPVVSKRLC